MHDSRVIHAYHCPFPRTELGKEYLSNAPQACDGNHSVPPENVLSPSERQLNSNWERPMPAPQSSTS